MGMKYAIRSESNVPKLLIQDEDLRLTYSHFN